MQGGRSPGGHGAGRNSEDDENPPVWLHNCFNNICCANVEWAAEKCVFVGICIFIYRYNVECLGQIADENKINK